MMSLRDALYHVTGRKPEPRVAYTLPASSSFRIVNTEAMDVVASAAKSVLPHPTWTFYVSDPDSLSYSRSKIVALADADSLNATLLRIAKEHLEFSVRYDPDEAGMKRWEKHNGR